MMIVCAIATAGQLDGQPDSRKNGYAKLQAKPAGREMTPAQLKVKSKYGAAVGALVKDDDKPPTPEELSAARGMEQMMVDLMITEMRKSVPENEVVPLSQGERIFRQMLDQEHARMLTEGGTLGIADLVLAQMRGKR
ncbi:MAG: rod-binding protein [Deltaproteobacteria bacterium]|nr:rod-binding protein [Deltaproteobacteria bacterium]